MDAPPITTILVLDSDDEKDKREEESRKRKKPRKEPSPQPASIVLDITRDDSDEDKEFHIDKYYTNDEWLISGHEQSLPNIVSLLCQLNRPPPLENDWDEEVIHLLAEDWLELEAYGICWIHSFAFPSCQQLIDQPQEFYRRLYGFSNGRITPSQLPLLQPENRHLPCNFPVLVFPVHYKSDFGAAANHWTLLVFFLEQTLHNWDTTKTRELVFYHLDSLVDYNLERATSYATYLHRIGLFLPQRLQDVPIRVQTVPGIPLQLASSRECGPRLVASLRLLQYYACQNMLSPFTLANTGRAAFDAFDQVRRHAPRELVRAIKQRNQMFDNLNHIEPDEPVSVICRSRYYDENCLLYNIDTFEPWVRAYSGKLRYIMCVDKVGDAESKTLSYFIVLSQHEHKTVTVYHDYQRLSLSLIDQKLTSMLLARGYSIREVRAYLPTWSEASHLCQYLMRHCYAGRLAPFWPDNGKTDDNLIAELCYGKRKCGIPHDQIWSADPAALKHCVSNFRQHQLRKTRSYTAFSLYQPVCRDWLPRWDVQNIPTYAVREVAIGGCRRIDEGQGPFFVFVRNGVDRLVLPMREIIVLIGHRVEEFQQACRTTPKSKYFVSGKTYEAPLSLSRGPSVYEMHLLSDDIPTPAQWTMARFVAQNFLTVPETDHEWCRLRDNVLEQCECLKGNGISGEHFMVSLLRMLIAVSTIPADL